MLILSLKDNDSVLSTPRFSANWKRRDLTTNDPRRSDSRFLHTGRRISKQLKLRTAAGALAQAKACWKGRDSFAPLKFP